MREDVTMSERSTIVRSLHDLGLAAWFGGSLMGATGLNGATSEARDPRERVSLATSGWAKWTPWQVAAIAAHTVGGIGLIAANRSRVRKQPGAMSTTVIKLLITGAAAGSTAYSGVLGLKVKQHQAEAATGVTTPHPTATKEMANVQRQLKLLQWATPALTAVLIVLGAVQGEQQRGFAGLLDLGPREVVRTAKQALKAAR